MSKHEHDIGAPVDCEGFTIWYHTCLYYVWYSSVGSFEIVHYFHKATLKIEMISRYKHYWYI